MYAIRFKNQVINIVKKQITFYGHLSYITQEAVGEIRKNLTNKAVIPEIVKNLLIP